MSVPSVDLEMQSPAHPFPTATGGDEEEDQQCWRDVEAETGFASYKSFLEALPETGPQYRDLLQHIGPHDELDTFGEVHVLNIVEHGGVSISMKLQGRSEHSGVDQYCTQLLRDLRSPPKDSPGRIIVWLFPRSFGLHPGLVDAIGLGLKIQPVIFATLLSKARWNFNKVSCRRFGPDYLVIGNSIATVAQNYIPNERVPSVLFVAKVWDEKTDPWTPSPAVDKDYHAMVIEALTTELHGSIRPCHPAKDMHTLKDLAPHSSGYLDRLFNHVLLSILSKYVQKGAGVGARNNGPLLNAILPLLHLKVLYLHAQREITHQALLMAPGSKYHYKNLDVRRFVLRRMLEDLEDSRNGLVKFARLQNAPKWLKEQPWLSQEEEIIEAVSEARAVEAEARDYMQLQIGNLSIEESRKSIQLSNQQMSEAKRGRIQKSRGCLMAY